MADPHHHEITLSATVGVSGTVGMSVERGFQLKVVGPEGVLIDSRVLSLVLPGAAGSLGVLAGHEPWTVLLKKGAVSYKGTNGIWQNIDIASGVASIEPAKTIILADKVD